METQGTHQAAGAGDEHLQVRWSKSSSAMVSQTSRLSSEGDLELWRRILSASIQPPPDTGETLALTRSAGERAWWREVCRGPRQATRPFRTGNR